MTEPGPAAPRMPTPADLLARRPAAPAPDGGPAVRGADDPARDRATAPDGAAPAAPDGSAASDGADDGSGDGTGGGNGRATDGGTGDGRVDAALRRLEEIEELPVSEHVARYDAVHRTLQDALATIDEG